ncbi:MAG: hypothetical protein KKC18_13530 [Chloroflexi bacterium]|nr:hypothetical protein [Chloroflexota bacterium]
MAGKSKRNLIEALLGIGMGIGGLLLLAYFMWGDALGLGSLLTDSDATLAQEPIELWDACEQAHEAALAEATDAQLVSASTQWQTVNEEMLMSGADDWSLVFYSSENSAVLDVVVTGDVAQVVNQTRVWVAPQVLDEGKWRAGPRDALLTFLAYGGREFLQEHPQAIVDLHLAESDDAGPTWIIVALDASDQSAFSLLIEAETGQVISTAPLAIGG